MPAEPMSPTSSRPSSPRADKPLHELLSHSLVDLYVGPDNTHWILHEKLLCTRSRFFQRIFYSKDSSNHQSYGLPDDEDEPFTAFVSWLYSQHIKPPAEEKDLTTLIDLYLMGEKWQAPALVRDALRTTREWYARTDTYPGLRRVQYVYANTDEDSEMRRLMVSSVARMMALNESIPPHWDKALRKNGQLAVDLIKSIQSWRIDPALVPDMRRAVEESADDYGADGKRKKEQEDNGDVNKLAEGFLKNGLGDDASKKADGAKDQGKKRVDSVAGSEPEKVKQELDENLPNGVGLPTESLD
ncbi:putative btb poz-like protein [Diplodia seriata]|uniref:Putative btb poz-like protein n=1 Tax=Diplodia seriata TaxID=420778 RepID=A0A0G2F381_9PEZI|nr:putative btb poz-like protein [Diplodia seriata]